MPLTQVEELERRIEAILFASGDPLECKKIAEILEADESTIHGLVERIRDRYFSQNSPLDIVQLNDSYQMCTLSKYADDIQSALNVRRGATLSQAALEALAIIAYNQPVTRAFVEEIRGVDCSSLVRNLVDKNLIEEAGRMNIPGKPIMYQTTPTFLRSFGLDSLEHLPILPDKVIPAPEDEVQVEGQIDFYQPSITED